MVLMYLYKHMKYDSRAEVLDIVQAQARLMGFLRKAKLWPFEGPIANNPTAGAADLHAHPFRRISQNKKIFIMECKPKIILLF